MKKIPILILLVSLTIFSNGHTEPPAALEFDHLVLLAPHEVGEYGGYKRRANEVVLKRGKSHLLVYPVDLWVTVRCMVFSQAMCRYGV